MKLHKMLLIAFAAMLTYCPFETILADSTTLDSSEAESLSYLREFSKYKWDIYRGSGSQMGPVPEEPILLALAVEEKHRMDTFKNLLDYYGIEDPVVSYEYWVYSDGFLTEDLNNRTFVGWGTRTWHFENCAYLEEMNIRDLRQAIAETDESLLSETYTAFLGDSYSNLVVLATWLHGDPADYDAQLLEQEDVDQILAGTAPLPIGNGFVINPGLNDAWYDPAMDGQGFFLAVYPETATVFLGWFTYDMEFPGQDANASLGDACQRWLTAQGPYDGAQAELVVYNSSGGLFGASQPVPDLEPIGSITLQFEDCENGSVSYDLPGIGIFGVIPIERVAPDNVAACEVQAYLAH
jgi:hypothetical protein